MRELLVSIALAFVLSGCAGLTLEKPVSDKALENNIASDKPTLVISKQGVMPAGKVYREAWPSQDGARSFPAEAVAAAVGAVADVGNEAGKEYFATQREMYRYRSDMILFNADNLSAESLASIVKAVNAPNSDADRPAFSPAGSASVAAEEEVSDEEPTAASEESVKTVDQQEHKIVVPLPGGSTLPLPNPSEAISNKLSQVLGDAADALADKFGISVSEVKVAETDTNAPVSVPAPMPRARVSVP